MRIAHIIALLLAISLPTAAFAQQVTFPAPAFAGTGNGWSIRLDTQSDGNVAYVLTPPGQRSQERGVLVLAASNEPRPVTYVLNSLPGNPWVAIVIVPFAQGESCASNRKSVDATYTIRVATTHAPTLEGCGDFTL